jgi:hypothetical protein
MLIRFLFLTFFQTKNMTTKTQKQFFAVKTDLKEMFEGLSG